MKDSLVEHPNSICIVLPLKDWIELADRALAAEKEVAELNRLVRKTKRERTK